MSRTKHCEMCPHFDSQSFCCIFLFVGLEDACSDSVEEEDAEG